MRCGQYQMILTVYQPPFLLCIPTPQHEDKVLAVRRKLPDDGIGKAFPA